ncbi:hypothetical protein ACODNH_08415 [Haloarcula sp. NS06]|uniref:hypothetical protein n=1 Tax=Haloarcula sp. NS06 TaxID=3409688 RepID=UPI003DA756B6
MDSEQATRDRRGGTCRAPAAPAAVVVSAYEAMAPVWLLNPRTNQDAVTKQAIVMPCHKLSEAESE